MKRSLQAMERAGRQHLDPEDYWDINAKAIVEERHIRERLIPEAARSPAKRGRGDAETAWMSFFRDLKSHYTEASADPGSDIMARASAGEYEQESPSQNKINGMLGLFVASAALIVAAALYGIWEQHFSLFILLPTAILICGGFLVGSSLGRFLHRRWCAAYLTENPAVTIQEIAWIILGSACVFLTASLRAYAPGERSRGAAEFLLVLILGLIVTCFQALHATLRLQQERLLQLEGEAQAWVADGAHAQKLREYQRLFQSEFRGQAREDDLPARAPMPSASR